jgi:hypothetical protein
LNTAEVAVVNLAIKVVDMPTTSQSYALVVYCFPCGTLAFFEFWPFYLASQQAAH